jgi:hypothetical protein
MLEAGYAMLEGTGKTTFVGAITVVVAETSSFGAITSVFWRLVGLASA